MLQHLHFADSGGVLSAYLFCSLISTEQIMTRERSFTDVENDLLSAVDDIITITIKLDLLEDMGHFHDCQAF